MATVLYYVRTTSEKKNPKVQIRVRFGISTTVFYGKTPYQIELKKWNQKAQKIKTENFKENEKCSENGVDINKDLLDLETYLLNQLNRTVDKETINGMWLKNQIDSYYKPQVEKEKKEVYLIDYIDNFIKNLDKKVTKKSGKILSEVTKKKYLTTQKRLHEFIENYNPSLLLKNVDLEFYEYFLEFLTHDKNYAVNTNNKHIAILKVFLNDANRRGFHIDLSGFIKPSEDSENIYLTKEDLNQLYNYDLTAHPYLERVRDLFIVGCWTGLRFSDLTRLTKDKIKDKTIEITTKKTGVNVTIPMFDHTRLILQKYNYELPLNISIQKFNDYIKLACQKAGLIEIVSKTITKGGKPITTQYEKWERVSSHTARRSFASNLYRAGLSHISIMEITGHKTEESFLKYIKVKPEEHAIKMQQFFDEMALKMVS